MYGYRKITNAMKEVFGAELSRYQVRQIVIGLVHGEDTMDMSHRMQIPISVIEDMENLFPVEVICLADIKKAKTLILNHLEGC